MLIEKVNAHSIFKAVHLILQGGQGAFSITNINMCIMCYKYLVL